MDPVDNRGLVDEISWSLEEKANSSPQVFIYTYTSSRWDEVSQANKEVVFYSPLVVPGYFKSPILMAYRKTKPKAPLPTNCGPASAMSFQNSASTRYGTNPLVLIRLACLRSTSSHRLNSVRSWLGYWSIEDL